MIKPLIEEIKNAPSSLELFNSIYDRPYVFFLDSSCNPKGLGRHSFLGSDPFLVFRSKGSVITLEWESGKIEKFTLNPFEALRKIFEKYKNTNDSSSIPFSSGGVGYFSYELKDFIEELPTRALNDIDMPDCMIGFYDAIFIYDNLEEKAYIASSGLPQTDHSKNLRRKLARLREFRDRTIGIKCKDGRHQFPSVEELRSNFSKSSYAKAVRKAKDYIASGDIYQVNLSQRFEADLDIDPRQLYLSLRQVSPAPFSSYLNFKDVAILSSSPERFLLKRGSYIETRPIKGTRPRGEDSFHDTLLEKELVDSPKDRAEHIMIVDLERNDLGRICEYGSVKFKEKMSLEKYANVFHLVSTVTGRLKEGVSSIDCLLATFPGGSITGAPKIRAMEIIEELEPVKRAIYTGAIGYISFDGNMDTSIVIRTFVIKDKKIYFQVGGGIVADSDPQAEYEETLHKARGLIAALGVRDEERECMVV